MIPCSLVGCHYRKSRALQENKRGKGLWRQFPFYNFLSRKSRKAIILSKIISEKLLNKIKDSKINTTCISFLFVLTGDLNLTPINQYVLINLYEKFALLMWMSMENIITFLVCCFLTTRGSSYVLRVWHHGTNSQSVWNILFYFSLVLYLVKASLSDVHF